jgi:hypothetical protein
VQRGDRGDLLFSGENPTHELEVGEAVSLLCGLREADHRLRGERQINRTE